MLNGSRRRTGRPGLGLRSQRQRSGESEENHDDQTLRQCLSGEQEAIRSATTETYVRWWVRWQRQNADAIDEMRTKHGTQILRTPPDILIAFLKAWDEIAKEESAKNPFFKKVLDSQRAYAAKVVPAKRFMFPPYSFAANYYFPETKPGAPAAAARK
jgi:hypothetical protein